MRHVLSDLCGVCNVAISAYIDTIEVVFPRVLTQEQRREIERIGRVKECRDHKKQIWGYRLILNQPGRVTLLRADHAAEKYHGVLSRFDLSVDLQPTSSEHACEIKEWITRSALLRWRRRGQMHDEEHGIYWVYWKPGMKRSSRNLVLYVDRYNRITGELDCVHLELRFLRARTIRRQGVRRVSDMLTINPNSLFEKHVKWTDAADNHVMKIVRDAITADRERYAGQQTSTFIDRYRSNRHRRVKAALHRAGYDRAQEVKDTFPSKVMTAISAPFQIPTSLLVFNRHITHAFSNSLRISVHGHTGSEGSEGSERF